MPGNRPYNPASPPSATSVIPEACTACEKRLEPCPTQGMKLNDLFSERREPERFIA